MPTDEIPEQKFQVFLSSTFTDLKEERVTVANALLKMGNIPAGMEDFTPSRDRGWETIQRVIDLSDYYVLIVAGRYGEVDRQHGISWTEREYEYALSRGMEVLVFLRSPEHIVETKSEKKQKGRNLLEAFKKKLRAAHLCSTWNHADDLAAGVVTALTKRIAEDRRVGKLPHGWYRGPLPQTQLVKAEVMPAASEDPAALERAKNGVKELHAQAVGRLAKTNAWAWLVTALTPVVPGDMPLDATLETRVMNFVNVLALQRMPTSTGGDRWSYNDIQPNHLGATLLAGKRLDPTFIMFLGKTGAGYIAELVGGIMSTPEHATLWTSHFVPSTYNAINTLVAHAKNNANAKGQAAFMSSVVMADGKTPMRLAQHRDRAWIDQLTGTPPVEKVTLTPAEPRIISLEDVAAPSAAVKLVEQTLRPIFQEFEVMEVPYFREGKIILRQMDGGGVHMSTWAANKGIPTVES